MKIHKKDRERKTIRDVRKFLKHIRQLEKEDDYYGPQIGHDGDGIINVYQMALLALRLQKRIDYLELE